MRSRRGAWAGGVCGGARSTCSASVVHARACGTVHVQCACRVHVQCTMQCAVQRTAFDEVYELPRSGN